MKQLSFTSNFLLKKIQQSKLIILIISVCFGNALFAQQLIVTSGASFVMGGAAFMVVNNASLINNGYFTIATNGTPTVMFTGTTNYNVGTTASAATLANNSTNFYNLTNSNTGTGTVYPFVTVANTLNVAAGTINAGVTTAGTSGNLTLLSTSKTSTANVAPVIGTITGNVNVQRYIPAKRAWRLLTAPVWGGSSIFSTWQNNGVSAGGIGMYITGPNATNASSGLDVHGYNVSSMKSWITVASTSPVIAANSYSPVTFTSAAISSATNSVGNSGYFVFVRGDRSTANYNTTISGITTLNSIGQLLQKTQTFSVPMGSKAGSYVLVGNPYAANIDFASVGLSTNAISSTNSNGSTNTAGAKNISTTFYTWEASLSSGGLGAYVTQTLNSDGVTYNSTPSTGNSSVIQSGQAFFVQTSADATGSNVYLTFNETNKNTTLTPLTTVFRPMAPSGNTKSEANFRANLFLLQNDSTTQLADGILTQFNDRFSDSVLIKEDAAKLTNLSENFGLLRHNTLLAVESRPNLSINDTLFLHLTQATKRAYQFQFEPSSLDKLNLIGSLQDKYLNIATKISLTDTTAINFTLDGNAASAAADRFQIVFKTFLPFAFTNIAAAKATKDIMVTWNVANETNILQYEVEKSIDGVSFTKVTTQTVVGSNNAVDNYTWLDVNARPGDNTYRVKMLGKDGKIIYTTLVTVTLAPITTGIFIYPNPVTNSTINLQMGNQPIGKYQLLVSAANGQIIYTGAVQNTGNNSQFMVKLPVKVAKGIYNLQITTPQNKITEQNLIVE